MTPVFAGAKPVPRAVVAGRPRAALPCTSTEVCQQQSPLSRPGFRDSQLFENQAQGTKLAETELQEVEADKGGKP